MVQQVQWIMNYYISDKWKRGGEKRRKLTKNSNCLRVKSQRSSRAIQAVKGIWLDLEKEQFLERGKRDYVPIFKRGKGGGEGASK